MQGAESPGKSADAAVIMRGQLREQRPNGLVRGRVDHVATKFAGGPRRKTDSDGGGRSRLCDARRIAARLFCAAPGCSQRGARTAPPPGVDGNQDDNSIHSAGAAYIFARSGELWTQQAYLKASNTGGESNGLAGDQFGYSVCIEGDFVLVGAVGKDSGAAGVNGNQADNSASSAGAAYLFERTGATWQQAAYLKASNAAAGDRFGTSVSLSEETLLVSARLEDSDSYGVNGPQGNNQIYGDRFECGAAYLFTRGSACPGNLDADDDVDLQDLAILLANFGRADDPPDAAGDVDNDGDTDLEDLALLLSNFAAACPSRCGYSRR